MTRDRRHSTLVPVERAPSGVFDARAGQEITMALAHDPSNIASAVLIAAGDRLFFPGDDAVAGEWRSTSDTTELSARPRPDILPASGGMDRAGAGVGHGLVFAADDGVHGIALWTSDGTEAGTRLIRRLLR